MDEDMRKVVEKLEVGKKLLGIELATQGKEMDFTLGSLLVILGTEIVIVNGLRAGIPVTDLGKALTFLRSQGWMDGFITYEAIRMLDGQKTKLDSADLVSAADQVFDRFQRVHPAAN